MRGCGARVRSVAVWGVFDLVFGCRRGGARLHVQLIPACVFRAQSVHLFEHQRRDERSVLLRSWRDVFVHRELLLMGALLSVRASGAVSATLSAASAPAAAPVA